MKKVLLLSNYTSPLLLLQFLLILKNVLITDLKTVPGYMDEHQHFCLYLVKMISDFDTKEQF